MGRVLSWRYRAWSLAATAAVCLAAEAMAVERELLPTIRWYETDFPPAFILRGERRGQGFYDRFFNQYLGSRLLGFVHQRVAASPARVQHDLAVVANACALGVEAMREAKPSFLSTEPLFEYLPLGLVVRRDEAERLRAFQDADGRVRIGDLLQSPAMRVGVAKSRPLGSQIGPLVNIYAERVVAVANQAAPSFLLRSLALQKDFDAALAYPFELTWLAESGPEGWSLRERLSWLPLAEMAEREQGRIACADSPQGRQVVKRLNKLLGDPAVREAMQAYYDSWLDEEGKRWLQRGKRPGTP